MCVQQIDRNPMSKLECIEYMYKFIKYLSVAVHSSTNSTHICRLRYKSEKNVARKRKYYVQGKNSTGLVKIK